jgi:hypothetical protein
MSSVCARGSWGGAVAVISLQDAVPAPIAREFPQARLQPAVDLRTWSPRDLRRANYVTRTAAQDMLEGRRRHRDLMSGAVGLLRSVAEALEGISDPLRPFLLLEDDCVPYQGMTRDVAELAEKQDRFDFVVFSPWLFGADPEPAADFAGCGWLQGAFWSTISVLYSASGQALMRRALSQPGEVQLDALLVQLWLFDGARVLVCERGALRSSRPITGSTIQRGLRVDDPLGDLQRLSSLSPPKGPESWLRVERIPLLALVLLLIGSLLTFCHRWGRF